MEGCLSERLDSNIIAKESLVIPLRIYDRRRIEALRAGFACLGN